MTTIDDGPYRSFSEDVRKKLVGFRSLSEYFVIRYQSTTSVQSPPSSEFSSQVKSEEVRSSCKMSSPKNSPGEARKQNGSRKRKRPSSLDSDPNGESKYKSCRVVRNQLYKIAIIRTAWRGQMLDVYISPG